MGEDLFGWVRYEPQSKTEAELAELVPGEHVAGVVGWEPCKEVSLFYFYFFSPCFSPSH